MLSALCVGINDYPGTDSDLGGCIADAKDWADYLLRKHGADTSQLLNDGASKDRIVDKLKEHVAALKEDDVFVFTYSGHGTWMPDLDGDEPDGRDEALCPYDMSETNLLLDDELHEIFHERHPKSRIVMITDSCHSGTVFRLAGPVGAKRKIRYLPPANFVRDPKVLALISQIGVSHGPAPTNRPLPNLVHLSGCSDKQFSYDTEFGGKPNGAFTRTVLNILETGTVKTYRELATAVKAALPSYDYPQTPRLNATKKMKDTPLFG